MILFSIIFVFLPMFWVLLSLLSLHESLHVVSCGEILEFLCLELLSPPLLFDEQEKEIL